MTETPWGDYARRDNARASSRRPAPPPPATREGLWCLLLWPALASAAMAGWALRGCVAGALLAALLLAPGCCAHAPAVEHAATHAALNTGHARDEALPRQAREIAADAARGWAVQYRLLTGEDPGVRLGDGEGP